MTSMMPIEPTYAAMATSPTTSRRFFRRHSESRYTHPTDVGGAALEATTDRPENAAMEEMRDEFGDEAVEEQENPQEEAGWVEEARKIWRRMSFGNNDVKPEARPVKPQPTKPIVHAAVQPHPEGKGKEVAPALETPTSAVKETPPLSVSIPQ